MSTTNLAPSAIAHWERMDISFQNYQAYLRNKGDRFRLTLVDLLYISNFKGGNAAIHEPEPEVNTKLQAYAKKLHDIEDTYGSRSLASLSADEVNELIQIIKSTCKLADKGATTKISGFGVSYLSALLAAYFPDLIPILDRRILNGLGMLQQSDVQKSGQVKRLDSRFRDLIKRVHQELNTRSISIRELDQELFGVEMIKGD